MVVTSRSCASIMRRPMPSQSVVSRNVMSTTVSSAPISLPMCPPGCLQGIVWFRPIGMNQGVSVALGGQCWMSVSSGLGSCASFMLSLSWRPKVARFGIAISEISRGLFVVSGPFLLKTRSGFYAFCMKKSMDDVEKMDRLTFSQILLSSILAKTGEPGGFHDIQDSVRSDYGRRHDGSCGHHTVHVQYC